MAFKLHLSNSRQTSDVILYSVTDIFANLLLLIYSFLSIYIIPFSSISATRFVCERSTCPSKPLIHSYLHITAKQVDMARWNPGHLREMGQAL